MQAALRLARHSLARRSATMTMASSCSSGCGCGCSSSSVRRLATTANPAHVASATAASPSSASSSTRKASIIPLSNIEAQWEKFSVEEKTTVYEQLEEVMKKDWKELSLDEKKAAYYVAFGPHGPRAPTSKPGDNLKVFGATAALVGVAGILFYAIRAFSPAPPRTINKEWEEAANERAKEQKMNPITGISSEGYSGKGFVTHK